jgi:hypothetical protein
MCGCGGIAAGAATTGAAATTGTAADFGPVAAAGKAMINRSIAVINTVKNPIFFMHFLLVRISGADAAAKMNARGSLSHHDTRDTRTV